MAALRLKLACGSIYFVAQTESEILYVHDPMRHGMDFGMIRLFEIDGNTESIVDRSWPKTLVSPSVDSETAQLAVLRYLIITRKKLDVEIQSVTADMLRAGFTRTQSKKASPRIDDISALNLAALASVAFGDSNQEMSKSPESIEL